MINNNDFKYIFKRVIAALIIAFILFNINKCNAKALVYKGSVYNLPTLSSGNTNSSLNSDGVTSIKWSLNNFNYPDNINLLSFKFSTYSFTTENLSGYYCSQWAPGSTAICGSTGCYSCVTGTSTTQSGLTYIYQEIGNYYVNADLRYVVNGYNVYVPCTLESSQDFQFYCPLNPDYGQPQAFNVTIKNSKNEKLYYNLTLTGTQYYYNYDSTEIVNGLSGVQQQQKQTNDTLTDSNISGANTITNNAISGIQNNVDSTLDNAISPNTLNTLLTGFVNQLSDTTCTPITLPLPYTDKNIVLPCLGTEFSQRIPIIWSLYELIITGVIVLRFWQHAVEYVLNILDPYHIGANNIPTGGGK